MAGLDFIIRGDNSNLLNKLKEVRDGVKKTADKIEESGMTIEDMFSRLTKAAAAFGAGFSATEFIKQIAQVRGEFQQLEVAFTTMLGGSQEAANDLMKQLVQLAAITPFNLQDVADGARQLLAYGEDVNKITDDLTRLGNISAGLSQPLGDLVYLYGTTMTQGRLYTQDLNQFVGRGIPMIRELAKVFGVAESEVRSLVEAGKIGFPEVQKVIQNLTNEGGMFYNLMQEQSKTITGQISNIEDSFSTMLNEIGKSNEGIINSALSGVSVLIENYETIGKVLITVISAYGAYKAALITVAALQRVSAIYGSIQAFFSLARSITSAKDAMILFNMVTKANPIGLILGAVAAAATAFGLFSKNANSASQVSTKFGEQASSTINKVNTLASEVNGLTKETSLRSKVMDELNGILEDYGVQAIKEGDSIDVVNDKRRQAIELIKQEAIERDRLNNIDAGDQEYQQKLQNAQNDFLKSLQNARSGSGGILSFVSDNSEIQDNASAISVIVGNVVQENISKIAGKTGEEYEKGLNEIFNTIQDRMRSIGISEKTITETWTGGGLFSQSNIVQDYIEKVQEASEEHDRYTDAVNKAADAEKEAADSTTTYGQKVAMLEKSLQKPNDSVHQLYTNIKNLMSQYSNNTIGFTIRIGGEIPKWMQDKNLPELQRLAKQFSAIGATSKNGAFVNGKYMTQQQLLQRGADYATAAELKQTEADRKKQEQANKKTESDNKKKNDNALREQQRAAEQRKRTQKQLNNDLLSLQQQNQDDEIALMREGTQKKLAEIKNDYAKRIAEIDKQEAEFKKKNKEAGATGLTGGLTKEQQTALQEARDNAAKEQERQTNEIYLTEAQAMRDYLKQYGTFQQQKLAIAEEYAEKIKNAQNEGERLTLVEERDRAIGNVNLSAIRQNIDWGSVFGDFGAMLRDEIETTLDYLRQYMRSDEYKAMSPTDQAQIAEAVENMRVNVTGDLSDVNFKQIGELTNEFQNAQRKMISAQSAEIAAYDNLKKAQTAYEDALANGTAEQQAVAKSNLDNAQSVADNMSRAYQDAVGEFNATGNNLKDATQTAVDAINSISNSISQLRSGSLASAYQGIQGLTGTLGKSLSGLSGFLGNAGKALSKFSSSLGGAVGEIVSAALGVLDLLKDGIGSIIADLTDLIFNAVNGILDDIFSGGIITKPLESVVKGAGNILNTISFGGFNSLLGIGSNAKEVQEAIDRLTDRNESLQQSIDDLKDTIQDASGAQSVEAARKAEEYQREQNENYLQIAREQARYSGAHHSWNYYWNGFSDEQIKKFSEQIGRAWNGDIFDLSPEEMKLLRGNIDMWEKIQNTGKGNYGGRLTDKLDDYIDQAGKLEEITNTLNETLTQISFDSLYDSFIDTLMDMDASAEDFADNFSEYLMRAVLSNQVGSEFKNRLQEWYEQFASAMEDGGLSDGELSSLRDTWDSIVNDGLALRDELAAAIGYDNTSSSTQQSASSKGFETMSQDTADELNGRFTALYEVGLRIDDSSRNIRDSIINTVTGINSLVSLTTDGNAELRNILAQQVIANSYLEDIVKYTKPIPDLGTKLDRIVAKVNNL